MSGTNIFLALTVLTAICAWYLSREDSKQKDRIENIGNITQKLTKEVENLSQINNSLAIKNAELTKQNIDLTNKANELISEVQKLTSTSNELIKSVDVRTENQRAENLLNGEFDFAYDKLLEDNEVISVKFGNNITVGNPVSRLKAGMAPGSGNVSLDGEHDLMPLNVIGGKLKFSATIYDLDGDWIADIENNSWQRNPNNTGRFNYDSKGFEIIDKKGFIALSVDLISRTVVSIQGYLVERRVGGIMFFGEKDRASISIAAPFIKKLEIIERVKAKRIFKYSGPNWLGERLPLTP